MRQIDSPPPNIWQSRGRWRGIGSKEWVPRTPAQRVGGFIIGTVYVAGALTMIGLSLFFKREFQAEIPSQPIAWAASVLAEAAVLGVASFVIWLGGRLLAGSFRRAPVQKAGRESAIRKTNV
jgi:hypothetical protein